MQYYLLVYSIFGHTNIDTADMRLYIYTHVYRQNTRMFHDIYAKWCNVQPNLHYDFAQTQKSIYKAILKYTLESIQ